MPDGAEHTRSWRQFPGATLRWAKMAKLMAQPEPAPAGEQPAVSAFLWPAPCNTPPPASCSCGHFAVSAYRYLSIWLRAPVRLRSISTWCSMSIRLFQGSNPFRIIVPASLRSRSSSSITSSIGFLAWAGISIIRRAAAPERRGRAAQARSGCCRNSSWLNRLPPKGGRHHRHLARISTRARPMNHGWAAGLLPEICLAQADPARLLAP